VNGKGDRSRVSNFTRYAKNYTKIFKKSLTNYYLRLILLVRGEII